MIVISGKAARSKWKNLKDHFRKEFKRSMESDQEMSRWPYFHSMMFIKDQISHTALNNALYSSADLQHQSIYPEVELKEEFSDGENPLNCLNIEYENQNSAEVTSANQDENISDDQHFLLSLLPMLCTLPMDKKLKARIAIETTLLNIAYPDLSAEHQDSSHAGQNDTAQKPSSTTRKRKRASVDELHAAKCFVNADKKLLL